MTAGNGAIVTIERFAISWNETMGVCEKRGKKMRYDNCEEWGETHNLIACSGSRRHEKCHPTVAHCEQTAAAAILIRHGITTRGIGASSNKKTESADMWDNGGSQRVPHIHMGNMRFIRESKV